jgi:hypothetical protein
MRFSWMIAKSQKAALAAAGTTTLPMTTTSVTTSKPVKSSTARSLPPEILLPAQLHLSSKKRYSCTSKKGTGAVQALLKLS